MPGVWTANHSRPARRTASPSATRMVGSGTRKRGVRPAAPSWMNSLSTSSGGGSRGVPQGVSPSALSLAFQSSNSASSLSSISSRSMSALASSAAGIDVNASWASSSAPVSSRSWWLPP